MVSKSRMLQVVFEWHGQSVAGQWKWEALHMPLSTACGLWVPMRYQMRPSPDKIAAPQKNSKRRRGSNFHGQRSGLYVLHGVLRY
jgi:hypothetical protein